MPRCSLTIIATTQRKVRTAQSGGIKEMPERTEKEELLLVREVTPTQSGGIKEVPEWTS